MCVMLCDNVVSVAFLIPKPIQKELKMVRGLEASECLRLMMVVCMCEK